MHLSRTAYPRPSVRSYAVFAAAAALTAGALAVGSSAGAAGSPVLLGTSQQFAVLGGAGVTNTGSTTIDMDDAGVRGDVGTYPTNTITGQASVSWLTPSGGGFHEADAVAQGAQSDSLTADGTAAGAPSSGALGGQLDTLVLGPGVHTASSALNLASNGTVVLDGEDDPDAEFIIQVGSSLTIESGATVQLTGGAQACHVFWQVGEDATIGVNSDFVGTVLAENAIVAQSGASIQGRLLAQVASVTLDNNTFVLPACIAGAGAGTDADGAGTATTADGGTGTTGTSTDSAGTGTGTTGSDGGTGTAGTNTDSTGTDADGAGTDSPVVGSSAAADGESAASSTDSGSGVEASSTTKLPDTGGPSELWLLVGTGAVLVGATAATAARRRQGGAHRG